MNSGIPIDRDELRRLREARVLGRRELARQAGVAESVYYGLEAGYYERALPATIRKIAGALGVKPEALTDVKR